ncbi:MAG: glucose 1-dehydrogenase [Nitrospirae bacterium]|nr:glucose 1-dehydrogenase [Nitrospirota bacterium]
MKAIAVVPGASALRLVDRPEPSITSPDEVKVRIVRVGICGTDREEAAGGRALAPTGRQDLVMGHEMLGEVVEAGKTVTRVRPGDYAVFTVRRGCGKCMPCSMNRPDMCRSGDYRERGIWGLDGYQTEYVVDKEQYVVRLPRELETIGVLCEPLSIVEKAVAEAIQVQAARMPDAAATPDWLFGRRCLVAGLGPVGLLAALALRLRGAEVYGLDIVDAGTARPAWLAHIGGKYIDGRQSPPDRARQELGPVDLIFEATGIAPLEFNLLDVLGLNGVYVLTGIPGGDRPLNIKGAELIRRLVLGNQVMVGSVNASRDHFQMAVDDLSHAYLKWGDHVARLITHRYPYTDFAAVLQHHASDEIKVVLEWQNTMSPYSLLGGRL